jgi:hypothetical protein
MRLERAHARAVHWLAVPDDGEGSDDLFLSVSVDGALKIWDARDRAAALRSECAQQWGVHVNRSHPITAVRGHFCFPNQSMFSCPLF